MDLFTRLLALRMPLSTFVWHRACVVRRDSARTMLTTVSVTNAGGPRRAAAASRRCDTPLRVPRKIPQLLKRSCRGQQRKASLLAGDVDVSPGAETVLTFPSVGGATDIHYYLGVQLKQTLNSTELLPHHRTVSHCLEKCAEPA